MSGTINQHFYLLSETQQDAINNVIEAMYIQNEGKHTLVPDIDPTEKTCTFCKFSSSEWDYICKGCVGHNKWRSANEL